MAATSGSTAPSRDAMSSSAPSPSSESSRLTLSSPSASTAVAGFAAIHASQGAKRAHTIAHPSSLSSSEPPSTGATISSRKRRTASEYAGFRPAASGMALPAAGTATGNCPTASTDPPRFSADSFW
jgi:hypothetical protein